MAKKSKKDKDNESGSNLNGTSGNGEKAYSPRAETAIAIAPAEPVIATRPALVPKPGEPATKKKTAAKKSYAASSKPATRKTTKAKKTTAISNDDIAVRAYLIAERRAQQSLPGNETTDWFEAKRQLEKEAKRA